MKDYIEKMQKSSHIFGGNSAYIDGLYELFLQNPTQISIEWQNYFNNLLEEENVKLNDEVKLKSKQSLALNNKKSSSNNLLDDDHKQAHVLQLINAFRLHGHHQANLDPLNLSKRKRINNLNLNHHNLSDDDLNKSFITESSLTTEKATLANIEKALKQTYCTDIGFEYMHISDEAEVDWLQNRIESTRASLNLNQQEKINILQQLTATEGLEKYLGLKYVGQKRFSLEGSDSFIPLMHELIDSAAKHQVREIVIGMAHRGRLNVLVNVLGKAPTELFQEFEGKAEEQEFTGDVKYHMGFSSDIMTKYGALHLSLSFNPSHLEIIAPVVEGSVRSKQRRRKDLIKKKQVVPIIVHGDAAFAGQGVVMETFNFSQARGYSTGGTVHVVINNQIGFTTSNPLDARSTLYCTDVAKMVQAPIFHVNADNPEAVIFVSKLAFDFRMKFKRDVVIDLVCYRRHGHNEADEPAITQPSMYKAIRNLATTRSIYADKLIKQNIIDIKSVNKMAIDYRDKLDTGKPLVQQFEEDYEGQDKIDWRPFLGHDWRESVNTGFDLEKLNQIGNKMLALPANFAPHQTIKRLIKERFAMLAGDSLINWGFAENLSYATLLAEDYSVRLSGQDCGRGTFSHRHAVLHDSKNGEVFVPLQNISDNFVVIDSVLSEEAVLGFEYGYASAEPNALVIWEAQFGDFANGAQVVIDQFISSGEQKWGRFCGLVMLLPHGFEGQGPEHSSARLERFLQLCAQHNMQVCVPSTPAQVFHMLRRQMLRKYRKPLIVMTPKSLLRHKLAVSNLNDLTTGKFELIIDEIDNLDIDKIKKLVLCSGKVYYDLLEQRRKNQQQNVAIIRIEQLYPFPHEEYRQILQKYQHVKDITWCQEEPQNQGAWYSSRHNMQDDLLVGQKLHYVGRDHFAAPAVGKFSLHLQQQRKLVEDSLRVN